MTENVEKNEDACSQTDVVGEETSKSEEVATEKQATEKKVEEDFRAKYYYLAAEMDNMHKRFNREKENLVKYGNEKILSNLVEVLDSFDHALKAIELDRDDKVANIYRGLQMVKDQLMGTLEKNGLSSIKAVGQVFDPNFHEALAQQPADGKNDEEILMEYQKGYVLNGRVLRASKVVIVKNNE